MEELPVILAKPIRSLLAIVVGLGLVLVLFTQCEEDETTSSDWDANVVLGLRADKDEAFRTDEHSPIPQTMRQAFTGLKYFDPDVDFVVDATIRRLSTPDTVSMQTTMADDIRRAVKIATLQFSVKGQTGQLTAYRFVNSTSSSWFVPFKDATNGFTTYQAGRYLDLDVDDADSVVTIDFNAAYNPYCAYDPAFSCPLVPPSNVLRMKIEAGEKKL